MSLLENNYASAQDMPLIGPTRPLPPSSVVKRLQQGAFVDLSCDKDNRIELIPALVPLLGHSKAYSTFYMSWLKKKDALNQDIFLIGSTGPLRRWLALHFCAIHGREVEYVALSGDTTESGVPKSCFVDMLFSSHIDLKQRREILPGGTSVFMDQAVVRAAIHGRVLVLEGLERAERNVLPVINNLLENREMALEDGRFLMAATRYDALARTQKKMDPRFIRTHPKFRVVALGVAVPPNPGTPLDPPLRSRFQGCRVFAVPPALLLAFARTRFDLSPAASVRLTAAAQFAALLRGDAKSPASQTHMLTKSPSPQVSEGARTLTVGPDPDSAPLPLLSEAALLSLASLWSRFPRLPVIASLHRALPWRS
jgi:hypothetical protein